MNTKIRWIIKNLLWLNLNTEIRHLIYFLKYSDFDITILTHRTIIKIAYKLFNSITSKKKMYIYFITFPISNKPYPTEIPISNYKNNKSWNFQFAII